MPGGRERPRGGALAEVSIDTSAREGFGDVPGAGSGRVLGFKEIDKRGHSPLQPKPIPKRCREDAGWGRRRPQDKGHFCLSHKGSLHWAGDAVGLIEWLAAQSSQSPRLDPQNHVN